MSIKYQMWLTYNAEKEKIQLPVLPETFKTNNGSSNDSMDITGLGEIIIMQSRPALQFSFSSFFPAARFPGLQVSSITKPLELVQKINTWKASKKPVHFIATACGVDLYCAIEKFNYSEEGGDPGTYQYIEYEKPLDPETAAGYALVADGVGCTGCVNEAASRDMDCCWDCNRNPRRKRQDLYRHRQPEVSGHD